MVTTTRTAPVRHPPLLLLSKMSPITLLIVVVLAQRAAERDVQHLNTAANAQQRLIRGACDVDDRDLVVVAFGIGRLGARVAFGRAVLRGIDVVAARHEHTVDELQLFCDVARVGHR